MCVHRAMWLRRWRQSNKQRERERHETTKKQRSATTSHKAADEVTTMRRQTISTADDVDRLRLAATPCDYDRDESWRTWSLLRGRRRVVLLLVVCRLKINTRLNVVWNNCFRHIFRCCRRESVKPLQYLCNAMPLSVLFDHTELFWKKMYASGNVIFCVLCHGLLSIVLWLLAICTGDILKKSVNDIKAAIWHTFAQGIAL